MAIQHARSLKKSLLTLGLAGAMLVLGACQSQPNTPASQSADSSMPSVAASAEPSLAASGSTKPYVMAEPGQSNAALDGIAKQILAELSFSDEMRPLEDRLLRRTYQIDPTQLKQFATYVSSGWTPEEVALFELPDEEAAKACEEKLQDRKQRQIERFTDYEPKEKPKAEGAVIKRVGRFVAYVAAQDAAKAEPLLETALGQLS